MKSIHVLSKRDELFLTNTYKLANVVRIPNSVDFPIAEKIIKTNTKILSILFVGELSFRKGVDILIHVMSNAPKEFRFLIAGEGAMKQEIVTICKKVVNCTYLGFLQKPQLKKWYEKSDILFAPTRAEGLSLVMLEALSFGLKIIGSKKMLVDFPSYAKYENSSDNWETYLGLLQQGLHDKQTTTSVKEKTRIQQYFLDNFTDKKILPRVEKELFDL